MRRVVWRHTVRGVRTLVGFAVLAVGLVLLLVPGPGLLVTALGLGLLAREFSWASRPLDSARRRLAPPCPTCAARPVEPAAGRHSTGPIEVLA